MFETQICITLSRKTLHSKCPTFHKIALWNNLSSESNICLIESKYNHYLYFTRFWWYSFHPFSVKPAESRIFSVRDDSNSDGNNIIWCAGWKFVNLFHSIQFRFLPFSFLTFSLLPSMDLKRIWLTEAAPGIRIDEFWSTLDKMDWFCTDNSRIPNSIPMVDCIPFKFDELVLFK